MYNYFRKVSDERKAIIWVISKDGQKTKEDCLCLYLCLYIFISYKRVRFLRKSKK